MNTLIIVDVQNDFLPSGALEVPEGDKVVPVINKLMPCFDLVIATQDWHPSDHGSFAAHHPGKEPFDQIELHGLDQTLWPVHCVQNTPGAEFAQELDHSGIDRIFQKGTDADIDSYSGFFDNGHRKATGLGDFLKQRGVQQVCVAGLATDYCVKFTALDARELGFETYVIEDACRGVDLKPGDVRNTIEELKQAGVEVILSKKVLK